MRERTVLLELFLELDEAIERIQWRFEGIESPKDFIRDRRGLDRLDGICMMLISIGENIRRLDKELENQLEDYYPQIDWFAIKGLRNILAHNYFSIDAEEVYKICLNDLEPLRNILATMRNEVF